MANKKNFFSDVTEEFNSLTPGDKKTVLDTANSIISGFCDALNINDKEKYYVTEEKLNNMKEKCKNVTDDITDTVKGCIYNINGNKQDDIFTECPGDDETPVCCCETPVEEKKPCCCEKDEYKIQAVPDDTWRKNIKKRLLGMLETTEVNEEVDRVIFEIEKRVEDIDGKHDYILHKRQGTTPASVEVVVKVSHKLLHNIPARKKIEDSLKDTYDFSNVFTVVDEQHNRLHVYMCLD